MIKFWGDVVGPYTYTSVLGGQITIAEVDAKYSGRGLTEDDVERVCGVYGVVVPVVNTAPRLTIALISPVLIPSRSVQRNASLGN